MALADKPGEADLCNDGSVMPEEPTTNFQIEVPDDLPNIYANFIGVWHTLHEFTLDFMVTGLPQSQVGESVVNVPARVVARIKVPPTVVDDMLRALATNVSLREDAMKAMAANERPGPNAGKEPQ